MGWSMRIAVSWLIFTLVVFSAFPGMAAVSPLTVLSAVPQGEVHELSQITVRFSQGMRPLGVSEQNAADAPLMLAVKDGSLPAGAYRWIDPSTLAYIFTRPVETPLNIIATVPKGVRSVNGAVLESSHIWNIATPPLTISGTESQVLPPDATLYIESNYPLDSASLKTYTRVVLSRGARSSRQGIYLASDIREAGGSPAHATRAARWVYEVAVQQQLPPDSHVSVIVGGAVQTRQGSRLGYSRTLINKTYSSLRVTAWDMYRISEKSRIILPESPLTLTFSNPVRRSQVLEHLQVSPAAVLNDDDIELDSDENEPSAYTHVFYFEWKPQSSYTVSLNEGLDDLYGGTLQERQQYTFRTGDFRPFFYTPLGWGDVVLEREFGGIIPLIVRNIPGVSVIASYVPLLEGGRLCYLPLRYTRTGRSAVKEPVVRQAHMDFSSKINTYITESISLPALLAMPLQVLSHGGIGLELTAELSHPEEKDNHLIKHRGSLQLTDLAVTTRMGAENGLAWVTSLATGMPQPGVRLGLYSADGEQLWEGISDAQGLAHLPGARSQGEKARYIWAGTDNDSVVANLESGLGWARFPALLQNPPELRIYPLMQLPLYQPGQEVKYTIFARSIAADTDGNGHEFADWQLVPQGRQLTVSIQDSSGNEVHAQTHAVNAFGAVSGSFHLPAEARLGTYYCAAHLEDRQRVTQRSAFQVASIRPPDFSVDVGVAADALPPQQGADFHRRTGRRTSCALPPQQGADPVQVTVSGRYFAGSVLDGAAVTLEFSRSDADFTPQRLHGYHTGVNGPMPYYGGGFAGVPAASASPARQFSRRWSFSDAGSATLDDQGRAVMGLPFMDSQPGRPQRIELRATVTDVSGLTSQGASSFMLHPSAAYVGMKLPRYAQAGVDVLLELKSASFDDKALPATAVTVTIEYLGKNFMRGRSGKGQKVSEETGLQPGVDGLQKQLRFAKAGLYHVTAAIRDQAGRENISRMQIFVTGEKGGWWPGSDRGTQLELEADKIEYMGGDTAHVRVRNPFERATALVTIEREGVYEARVEELKGPMPVLHIPVSGKSAPYVFVSVVAVQGRTAPPPVMKGEGGPDTGAPRVAAGSVLLVINQKNNRLHAQVKTDAKTYRPGETVTVSVAVRNAAGAAGKAQVTLLAVDSRILRASGDKNFYDPLSAFATPVGYGMVNADTRTALVRLDTPRWANISADGTTADMMDARKANPAALSQNAPVSAAEGTQDLRENFSPNAYWLGMEETDSGGKLKKTFILPDTLTSYRIVAVAADMYNNFAVAEEHITASKAIQIFSAMPRFVVAGDSLVARFTVQNKSGKNGIIRVEAQAEGLEMKGAVSKDLHVGPGAGHVVEFTLAARQTGQAKLAVRATMGKEWDAARFVLPVLEPRPLTTVAAAGILAEGETFSLPVETSGRLDPRSRLELVMAPSPAAGLAFSARSLIDYPWHCLEQRLSRAWVRALRLQHGELLGLAPDPTDRDKINEVFSAVSTFQRPDGGFALWPGMPNSDLYLTGYVLLINAELKTMDVGLDKETEQRAVRFLRKVLQTAPDQKHAEVQLDTDTLAMAYWILCRYDRKEGQALSKRALQNVQKNSRSNPIAIASLMLAMRELPMLFGHDKIFAELRGQLEKTAVITPAQLHFSSLNKQHAWMNMGSTLRDNGLVLWALARVMPEYPALEGLARWVGQELSERTFVSTQEAMFGVLGLVQYLKLPGRDQAVRVRADWNGQENVQRSFARFVDPPSRWVIAADALAATPSATLRIQAEQGAPYWTARLRYTVPSQPVAAVNAGFGLSRSWSSPGPWRMGDLVTVTIKLSVPATRRHVLVHDPFPAGLEPAHVTRADLTAEQSKSLVRPWQWQEMRDTGLLLYAAQVTPGEYSYSYTLRAAAPGSFVQRPSVVEEMYTPEVFGMTGDDRVTVTAE